MAVIKVTPVAQRRVLHYADKGNDVLAYQRALVKTLKALHYVPVTRSTGEFGQGTLKDTLRLQAASGIQQSGRVGSLTWTAIDPKLDAFGKSLLVLKPPPVAPIGNRISHQMQVQLALGLRIYSQRRPAAKTLEVWKSEGGDCSGSELLAVADAQGVPFSGLGNTGTIWDTWEPVSERDVQVGDAILYGSGGKTDHTANVDSVKLKTGIGFGAVPGRRLPWRYRPDLMGFRRLPAKD